jgi:hypothetical protein
MTHRATPRATCVQERGGHPPYTPRQPARLHAGALEGFVSDARARMDAPGSGAYATWTRHKVKLPITTDNYIAPADSISVDEASGARWRRAARFRTDRAG